MLNAGQLTLISSRYYHYHQVVSTLKIVLEKENTLIRKVGIRLIIHC